MSLPRTRPDVLVTGYCIDPQMLASRCLFYPLLSLSLHATIMRTTCSWHCLRNKLLLFSYAFMASGIGLDLGGWHWTALSRLTCISCPSDSSTIRPFPGFPRNILCFLQISGEMAVLLPIFPFLCDIVSLKRMKEFRGFLTTECYIGFRNYFIPKRAQD